MSLRQALYLNPCMIIRILNILWNVSACTCGVCVSPAFHQIFLACRSRQTLLNSRTGREGGIEMSMTLIWYIWKSRIKLSIMYWLVLICCIFVGFSHTLSRSRCYSMLWIYTVSHDVCHTSSYTVMLNTTKSSSSIVFLCHGQAVWRKSLFVSPLFFPPKYWL